MDAEAPPGWRQRLGSRSHVLLAVHLLLLHVLAFGGWQVQAIKLLWLVALGLFLIWQPFIAGERQVSATQLGALLVVAVLSTLSLGPWLLLVWCGALAAVIGGRVLWTESRRERAGYLTAFGYLVAIAAFGVLPEISPIVVLDPIPRDLLARYLPLLLLPLPFLTSRSQQPRTAYVFDLFYGVMVFLVLSVFVLGALAYMLIGGVSYIESLVKTSLSLAGALLVVAWAWNPRAGFSGVGWAISRYLLSVGMPLEQWLVQLSEDNEREPDPELFLARVMQRLHSLAWVVGVRWQTRNSSGKLSQQDSFAHHYDSEGVSLTVFARSSPTPAMIWHVGWLLRLAGEFYVLKRQTDELRRVEYLKAVYETGARVTHDVKNLLQSMQVLCYAALQQPGNPEQLTALLGRQLPQITDRLRATLVKLQSPSPEKLEWVDANAWWHGLVERYAYADILWKGEPLPDTRIPEGLFDSVIENLVQNALGKRLRHHQLLIEVGFLEKVGGVRVADSGPQIPDKVVSSLLREPVASDDGLGIGLFHAARQAEALNYRLGLTENSEECVAFELAPMTVVPEMLPSSRGPTRR